MGCPVNPGGPSSEGERVKILVGISSFTQDLRYPVMGSERAALGMAKALARRQHVVEFTNITRMNPDWSKRFDVLLLANANGPKGPYQQVEYIAHEKGIPVVVMPIYWPVDELRRDIKETLELSDEEAISQALGFNCYLEDSKRFFADADWWAPNAESEMEQVVQFLDGIETRVPLTNYTVIPNAVDVEDEILPALENAMEFPEELKSKLKPRFILEVGRIEVRKNQLRLLKAMEQIWKDDPDLQLVLVGNWSEPYAEVLQPYMVGRNVLVSGAQPPSVILQLMKRAQAHVLPSWLETPGLSSLEASALNKPIVVGDRGSVREYFQDVPGVFYSDPMDVDSIEDAIRRALAFGPAPALGQMVRTRYSYSRAAELAEELCQSLEVPCNTK